MNDIKTVLNDFLINTKTTSALIFDVKGKLITSLDINYSDSVAAMSAAILSMCEKFLSDLEKGSLKQLYLKTTEGIVIGNKINTSNFIVVFSESSSNIGLLMHNTEELASELGKNPLLK
ncbi:MULTISPECIES: roadblock/LC7 domain-containing protein [Flavobacterium]|uniref:Roadblock/LC7 domain-containing protein n=2 Tax=Flavobacterium TaxID=237 RepID=A0A940XF84_9FLAO|nr:MULTISPECIES: roadblock/LC7 domain-containing protein [Flavobacterium]MBP4138188.1 roadblock/LC7 domain-containing protein [Flavobacterium geliluteum]MDX6180713.1 roadblock/LC7 domain-containing protein [Flavobacterium sp. Fl-33]MDX6184313.1 roadblock/LC7 domain-containing protein [Flavobacterium sp. Fl-77]UFH39423.1 roadblock/LC7 domain-containing protein [Flavobacterium sp. F-70]